MRLLRFTPHTMVDMNSIHVSTLPAGPSLPRPVAQVVLAAGPLSTVLFLAHQAAGSQWLHPSLLPVALIAALICWSPLPVSVPAIILGDARDQALPQLRGPIGSLIRAFQLIPYLLISPKSGVRTEMLCSVIGLAVAVAYSSTLV